MQIRNLYSYFHIKYCLQAGLHVNDLFTDLADGKLLLRLLEIISGDNLGRPNKGVLRVQKIENVNRCLEYLRSKVSKKFNKHLLKR